MRVIVNRHGARAPAFNAGLTTEQFWAQRVLSPEAWGGQLYQDVQLKHQPFDAQDSLVWGGLTAAGAAQTALRGRLLQATATTPTTRVARLSASNFVRTQMSGMSLCAGLLGSERLPTMHVPHPDDCPLAPFEGGNGLMQFTLDTLASPGFLAAEAPLDDVRRRLEAAVPYFADAQFVPRAPFYPRPEPAAAPAQEWVHTQDLTESRDAELWSETFMWIRAVDAVACYGTAGTWDALARSSLVRSQDGPPQPWHTQGGAPWDRSVVNPLWNHLVWRFLSVFGAQTGIELGSQPLLRRCVDLLSRPGPQQDCALLSGHDVSILPLVQQLLGPQLLHHMVWPNYAAAVSLQVLPQQPGMPAAVHWTWWNEPLLAHHDPAVPPVGADAADAVQAVLSPAPRQPQAQQNSPAHAAWRELVGAPLSRQAQEHVQRACEWQAAVLDQSWQRARAGQPPGAWAWLGGDGQTCEPVELTPQPGLAAMPDVTTAPPPVLAMGGVVPLAELAARASAVAAQILPAVPGYDVPWVNVGRE